MKNKGFTLVEILVVVSVIGIITALVLVNLNSAKDKATDVKSVQELDQLRKALELYRTDNGKYPGEENTEYSGITGTTYKCSDGSQPVATTTLNPTPWDERGLYINNGYKCNSGKLISVNIQSVFTLFKKELVGGEQDDGTFKISYISAVPYYVAEVNDFRYLTGTEAQSYNCGGQTYSSYLIVFHNQNYDLNMSTVDGLGNCTGGNDCIYCFGY